MQQQTEPKQISDTTKPNCVPDKTGVVVKEKKKGGAKAHPNPPTIYLPETADLSLRKKFTRLMAERARVDGIHPLELLSAIAMDPTLTFTDWLPSKGTLIQIERTATLSERIECAKTVLPYIETRKVEVAHSGTVTVLHALAETALDATTLDDEGNVIDADFEDLSDIDE